MLQLLHDQSRGDIPQSRTAVAANRRPKGTEFSEFLREFQRHRARTMMLHHHGHEALVHKLPHAIAQLPFISRDPPEHDQLRELATRPFGPPQTPDRVDGLRPWLAEVTNGLIDDLAGRRRVDIVDDFAYPLPVTAICRLLGVPREDEPRFRHWADAIVETVDPSAGTFAQRQRMRDQVFVELGMYLKGLADARARDPVVLEVERGQQPHCAEEHDREREDDDSQGSVHGVGRRGVLSAGR